MKIKKFILVVFFLPGFISCGNLKSSLNLILNNKKMTASVGIALSSLLYVYTMHQKNKHLCDFINKSYISFFLKAKNEHENSYFVIGVKSLYNYLKNTNNALKDFNNTMDIIKEDVLKIKNVILLKDLDSRCILHKDFDLLEEMKNGKYTYNIFQLIKAYKRLDLLKKAVLFINYFRHTCLKNPSGSLDYPAIDEKTFAIIEQS